MCSAHIYSCLVGGGPLDQLQLLHRHISFLFHLAAPLSHMGHACEGLYVTACLSDGGVRHAKQGPPSSLLPCSVCCPQALHQHIRGTAANSWHHMATTPWQHEYDEIGRIMHLRDAHRCRALCCAVLCCAVLCCAVLCCAVLWSLLPACQVQHRDDARYQLP